ncbi:hypothetical protein HJG60_012162 [Phyllostomus discolor]|uniref:Uncharacterized protein n=1 Tax=Phyllostomus discolor TaxID=89673 RepID=A0A834DUP0_9CHIR|nr:hypothetical protein HJG60_012162 [Phyllostomus discolor]
MGNIVIVSTMMTTTTTPKRSRYGDVPSPCSGVRAGLRQTFQCVKLLFGIFSFSVPSHDSLPHSFSILYLYTTLYRLGEWDGEKQIGLLSRLKVFIFQNSVYSSLEFQNFTHTSLTFPPSGWQSSMKKKKKL